MTGRYGNDTMGDSLNPLLAERQRASTVQLDLAFDPEEARRDALETERDTTLDAIDQVDQNASDQWKEQARAVVEELARTRPTFISDDVWLTGLPKPSEARALGAIMLYARTRGFIVSTSDYLPSAQPGCHGMPRRVWKSLIYAGAPS